MPISSKKSYLVYGKPLSYENISKFREGIESQLKGYIIDDIKNRFKSTDHINFNTILYYYLTSIRNISYPTITIDWDDCPIVTNNGCTSTINKNIYYIFPNPFNRTQYNEEGFDTNDIYVVGQFVSSYIDEETEIYGRYPETYHTYNRKYQCDSYKYSIRDIHNDLSEYTNSVDNVNYGYYYIEP